MPVGHGGHARGGVNRLAAEDRAIFGCDFFLPVGKFPEFFYCGASEAWQRAEWSLRVVA